MFRKLKDWIRNEKTLEIIQNENEDENDPRELPRPLRSDELKGNNTIDLRSMCSQCNCKNCWELLDNFSECAICMEPLQGVPICSCIFCGNYTCWTCSEKVYHCPFCRTKFHSNQNRIRNFALERILMKLQLPCRHARWGCYARLNHTDRSMHETSCQFAPSSCPLAQLCGWHGDVTDIARHLKDTHAMTLIAANGINVEIADFHLKLLNTLAAPRLYTVSLTCHGGHIFVCKVKLLEQKLRLNFVQVITAETQITTFGVWLEIVTFARTLRGVVKISPKQRRNREIIVPKQAFAQPPQQRDDVVKISITIKPMH